MTNLSAWKQNRIRVLRTLFNENGAIAGSGPLSLLLCISFGIILLYGAAGITKFANSSESSVISSSGYSAPGIFQTVQLAQRACVLNRTDSLKVIGALEVWAHSPPVTWTGKSFRNNNQPRMNNG